LESGSEGDFGAVPEGEQVTGSFKGLIVFEIEILCRTRLGTHELFSLLDSGPGVTGS
jgi:hypothetical protein